MKRTILVFTLLIIGAISAKAQMYVEKDFYFTAGFGGVYLNNANMKVWSANPKGTHKVFRDQLLGATDFSVAYIADDMFSFGLGLSLEYSSMDQLPDFADCDTCGSYYLPLDLQNRYLAFSPYLFFQYKYEINKRFAVGINAVGRYQYRDDKSYIRKSVDVARDSSATASYSHLFGGGLSPVIFYQINRDFGLMLSVNALNYDSRKVSTNEDEKERRFYFTLRPEYWRLGIYKKF